MTPVRDVAHVMVDGELDPTAAERTEPTVLATDTVQFDPVAAAVRDR